MLSPVSPASAPYLGSLEAVSTAVEIEKERIREVASVWMESAEGLPIEKRDEFATFIDGLVGELFLAIDQLVAKGFSGDNLRIETGRLREELSTSVKAFHHSSLLYQRDKEEHYANFASSDEKIEESSVSFDFSSLFDSIPSIPVPAIGAVGGASLGASWGGPIAEGILLQRSRVASQVAREAIVDAIEADDRCQDLKKAYDEVKTLLRPEKGELSSKSRETVLQTLSQEVASNGEKQMAAKAAEETAWKKAARAGGRLVALKGAKGAILGAVVGGAGGAAVGVAIDFLLSAEPAE